jgi:hypothetical protein
MKSPIQRFNIFKKGGLIEKTATQMNARNGRWFDWLMGDLDLRKDDPNLLTEAVLKDTDVFLRVSERLSVGKKVNKLDMDTFLKVACNYYNQRVHPKEIVGLQFRGRVSQLSRSLGELDGFSNS